MTLRRRLLYAALAASLLLALDLSRPPGRQLTARALLTGIDLYQATLSRLMPGVGIHCRFTPTCSHYAEAVIQDDGALIGTLRALHRLGRCGPWTPAGTHDPP